MNFRLDVYVHGGDVGMGPAAVLEEIRTGVRAILQQEEIMLERLAASIEGLRDVKTSIIALLDGLSAQIRDLAAQPRVDQARLSALADAVDQEKADLVEAALRNTPSAPPA